MSSSATSIVEIELDKNEIRNRAVSIAAWNNRYDTYIWLTAEAELRIAKALVSKLDKNSTHVQIDLHKVVNNPSIDEIKQFAQILCGFRPMIQDVHWFLAERRYIFDCIKSGKFARAP
jgi:hypothetical protein